MRFMVIAAERAPTMATMIQKICQAMMRPGGQFARPARSASNAATNAKGSAKTECSNLIISSTVRIRLRRRFKFAFAAESSVAILGTRPAVLLILRQIELCQHAKNELLDKMFDGFRFVVKRRDCGHDHSTGVVDTQHIFEMDAVERRFAQAENQFAALFEANISGASEQIVADAAGD